MTVTAEFKEASARSAIRALRGLESTAKMLETYAADTFPPDAQGKIHFGRLLMDSAAEAIRDAWRIAIRDVEHFPDGQGGMIEEIGLLRNALGKIADLQDSEAGEPLDDAIEIARKALNSNL